MDILKLVDKYGPELAKQLQIATGQVYEKVLWYVQLNGIITLGAAILTGIVCLVLGIILTKLVIHFYKIEQIKSRRHAYHDMFGFWMMTLVSSVGVFTIVPWLVFTVSISLVSVIAQIFFPEYWIINQVINKIGQ